MKTDEIKPLYGIDCSMHQSEAAARLTSYHRSPGDLDFTLFMNERGK